MWKSPLWVLHSLILFLVACQPQSNQSNRVDESSSSSSAASLSSLSVSGGSLGPTSATTLTFIASFSTTVYGLSLSDFQLTTTGSVSASIDSLSDTSGSSINIIVTSISGDGTLRVDLKDSDKSIYDSSGNSLSNYLQDGTDTIIIDNSATAPSALELISPASTTGTLLTPTLEVGGLEDSGSVFLYQDATCSTFVASTTITSASTQLTLTTVSAGANNFYAKQVSALGFNSPCSTASLTYTYHPLATETALFASDKASGDQYAFSLSISEHTAVVGAPYEDSLGTNAGAIYVYFFDHLTGVWDETKLTASDGAAGDFFGYSVDVDHNTIVVGAPGDADNGTQSGSLYIFRYDLNDKTWRETKITASDGAGGDWFGAAVSVHAQSILVGAIGDDDQGSQSGNVYLYRHIPSSSTWQETKFSAADGEAGDYFGFSVAMGNGIFLVGAPTEDAGGSLNAGSVYAYRYNAPTDTWFSNKLNPSDAAIGDQFGYSLDLKGNVAVAGAPYADPNGLNSGSAYHLSFQTASNTWTISKLTASDGQAYDYFGSSVSLDTQHIAVGAPGDDDIATSGGSFYQYTINPASPTQYNEAKYTYSSATASASLGYAISISQGQIFVGAPLLESSSVQVGAALIYRSPTVGSSQLITSSDYATNDVFGTNVSIDGFQMVIGAAGEGTNGASSGAAYVYRFDLSENNWVQTKLLPSDGAAGDGFGTSVAISGNTIVIGAPFKDASTTQQDTGKIYIYSFNPTLNTWAETPISESTMTASSYFGQSVAIDGHSLLVGAPGMINSATITTGSAYLYQFNGTAWASSTFSPSDGSADDLFGSSVAIDGQSLLIGSPQEDSTASISGAAYLYQFNPATDVYSETKLKATTTASEADFGGSVALENNIAVIGAQYPNSTGQAHLFTLDPVTNIWSEAVGKLSLLGPSAGDLVGSCVDISGNTILVGAQKGTQSTTNSGVGYLFKYDAHNDLWNATTYQAINPVLNEQFGISCSLSGERLLLGADAYDSGSSPLQGAATLFELSP